MELIPYGKRVCCRIFWLTNKITYFIMLLGSKDVASFLEKSLLFAGLLYRYSDKEGGD